ncbi:MAG: DUF697 domain-containing protein [Gemmataceae bacterium]
MSDSNANLFNRLWQSVRPYVAPDRSPEAIEKLLADVRAKAPAPTFWLFGKTQSGKSSIIKYLTGVDDAMVGEGFRPCTLTTQMYPFPSADTPLMTFLDTRGLGDPNYNPANDIKEFEHRAQLMIVTVKLTDLAQGIIVEPLKTIRNASLSRPVLLVLTCLHDVDPTSQHPQPYPFTDLARPTLPEEWNPKVRQLIEHHRKTFEGLVDSIVLIDLTKPEEGYTDPLYGGPQLKSELMRLLPTAYRHSLQNFDAASDALKDLHLRAARPVIAGYAATAAAVAAVPIPFVDLLVLPAIQVAMCQHLGKLSGHPAGAERFAEMAASLGAGLIARQAVRELAKVIPVVGSAVAATAAGASTYALGRAFCLYDQRVNAGHLPDAAADKKLYDSELNAAKNAWEVRS